jgi:hypothetical protein
MGEWKAQVSVRKWCQIWLITEYVEIIGEDE